MSDLEKAVEGLFSNGEKTITLNALVTMMRNHDLLRGRGSSALITRVSNIAKGLGVPETESGHSMEISQGQASDIIEIIFSVPLIEGYRKKEIIEWVQMSFAPPITTIDITKVVRKKLFPQTVAEGNCSANKTFVQPIPIYSMSDSAYIFAALVLKIKDSPRINGYKIDPKYVVEILHNEFGIKVGESEVSEALTCISEGKMESLTKES